MLTGIQMRSYRKHFSGMAQLSRDGYLGVGSSAGRISPGVVVLLATDATGTVLRAERMRGWTVFARFQPFPEVEGLSVFSIAEDESIIPVLDRKTLKGLKMAAELLVEKMRSHKGAPDKAGNSGVTLR